MKIPQLPPSALPQYIHFQPIALNGLNPTHLGGSPIDRGTSLLFANSEHSAEQPLLRVSPSLIISLHTVEASSKSDRHLHDALKAAGSLAHTARGAAMVFLLLRMGTAAGVVAGERDGWCEYVQFLPRLVLLPTTYTSPECKLLTGISLEAAVASKLRALQQEFEALSAALPWAALEDWVHVDSLYRSRSLALPAHGTAMVPVLDFANHDEEANAFFAVNDHGEVTLDARPGVVLKDGEEVTIDYSGAEPKSAAEMVFSYGFLPESLSTARSLTLPLEAAADDPLGRAKEVVWKTPKCVKIFETEGDSVGWEAPFIYLSVVNEEDGLVFQVLQTMEGERKLQALFQEEKLDPESMEERLRAGAIWEVFQLRAVVTLKGVVESQLGRLLAVKDELELEASEVVRRDIGEGEDKEYRPQPWAAIMKLRELEETLLLKAVDMFDKQQATLLARPTVQDYLLNMQQQKQEEEVISTQEHTVEDDDGEIDLS